MLLLLSCIRCYNLKTFCVLICTYVPLLLVSCHTSFGLCLSLLLVRYSCTFAGASSLQSFIHSHDACGCCALKTLMSLLLYRAYLRFSSRLFCRFLCRLIYVFLTLRPAYLFHWSTDLHLNRYSLKRNLSTS